MTATLSRPAAGTRAPAEVRDGPALGTLVRTGFAVLVVAALVVLLVRQRASLGAGWASIGRADLVWLAPAAAGRVLLWTAGTVSQLGSIPARMPVRRLFAVQVAGTFANHVLPAGSGGMAVTLRFLTRHGLSRTAAAGAVTLNVAAGAVTQTALLVLAVVLAPASLTAALTPDVPGAGQLAAVWPALAAAGGVLAVLAAWLAPRAAPSVRTWWAQVPDQLASLVAVLRTPVRAAQLWLGSAAVPVLHGLTLYAVLRSLGGAVPVLEVTVAYLVASSVSALLPSPGGLGALDIALVAALVAVGAPAATALAAVLAYRVLTVWLPLLPGACVLAMLVHRKVV